MQMKEDRHTIAFPTRASGAVGAKPDFLTPVVHTGPVALVPPRAMALLPPLIHNKPVIWPRTPGPASLLGPGDGGRVGGAILLQEQRGATLLQRPVGGSASPPVTNRPLRSPPPGPAELLSRPDARLPMVQ